jgi:hypothetical protein
MRGAGAEGMKLEGVRAGPLWPLGPVLKTWLELMDIDAWGYSGDAPWWYNERAVLSLLAGAVWRHKGWAFEEYSTSKQQEEERAHGQREKYSGRDDLMFEIGRGARRRRYVAEAKACSPSLARDGDALAAIDRALGEACGDVLRSPERGWEPIGIVFASPCLKATQRRHRRERVEAFLRDLMQLKSVGLAWTFPESGARVKTGGYIYPGAVVAIKPAR